MKINFQSPPKYLDEKMVCNILRDYKMLNCEVLIRDDEATVDDLIDVIMKDHRKYIKCLYVYNKIDSVSLDFLDKLAREPQTVVMSCPPSEAASWRGSACSRSRFQRTPIPEKNRRRTICRPRGGEGRAAAIEDLAGMRAAGR